MSTEPSTLAEKEKDEERRLKAEILKLKPSDTLSAFDKLFRIVRILRSPSGCPWDRKQTIETLLPHILEEVYEAVDAVHSNDIKNLSEEIGDLYLLVVMISYILEETESIPVKDTINGISDKLLRRHPHVFGEISADNADDVLEIWNNIKTTVENRAEKNSLLDSIPLSAPPLERAFLMQKKAAETGFDWPDISGVFKKIHEEIDEFNDAVESGNFKNIKEEFGDILFSMINAARYAGIDPSEALHGANQKFFSRFKYIEARLSEKGLKPEQSTLEEMDSLWNDAKDYLTE